MDTPAAQGGQEAVECRQCGRKLSQHEEKVQTEGGVFCTTCFGLLKDQISSAIGAQAKEINYSAALLGGLLGGAGGALVWWGFTVMTGIAFGLVAIVIGFAVSRGISYFTGGKRALGLQILSVAIAAVSYFYASYLVNRTFLLRYMEEQGQTGDFPWLPDPQLFYRVVSLNFEAFDLIFLAIVIWEAWRGLAPLKLTKPQGAAA